SVVLGGARGCAWWGSRLSWHSRPGMAQRKPLTLHSSGRLRRRLTPALCINDPTSPLNLVSHAGYALGRTYGTKSFGVAIWPLYQRHRCSQGTGRSILGIRLHLAGDLYCDACYRTSIRTVSTGARCTDFPACLHRGNDCGHRCVTSLCLDPFWLHLASRRRYPYLCLIRLALRHCFLPCRRHNISSKRTRERAARRLTQALDRKGELVMDTKRILLGLAAAAAFGLVAGELISLANFTSNPVLQSVALGFLATTIGALIARRGFVFPALGLWFVGWLLVGCLLYFIAAPTGQA